jgi:hypothetical protein
VPTAILVFGIWFFARSSGMHMLSRGIPVAVLAGVLATLALDVIRLPSTFAGYLPMDEAREIAADLFPAQSKGATPMQKPGDKMPMNDGMTKPNESAGSMPMHDTMQMPALTPFQVFLGYLYHYWNGVSFALVFVILFGRVRWWAAVLYAVFFVDAGMMVATYLWTTFRPRAQTDVAGRISTERDNYIVAHAQMRAKKHKNRRIEHPSAI